ncbi:MAG: hypothetical protein HY063_08965 [Bacteroidetes bacterium]|nr:hypothetical protein [Bacteroidota bacterium]
MKITKKNYFSEVKRIGFENLPEALKKTHLVLMTKTDQGNDWATLEKDNEFKKVVDLAFEKLGEFIKNNKKDLSGITERNALLDGTFKPSESLEGTDSLSLELKFILRFLNMTGKIISKRELKNYIEDLQDAIRKKQIRKTATHAEEIVYIQKSLVRIYNGMKRKVVVLELKKETSKRLKTIVTKTKKKIPKKKSVKSVSLKGIPEPEEKKEATAPQNHLMSSVDFSEMKFDSLGFSKKWRDLIGDPSRNFSVMIFGRPKTGKSYLAIDFAGYLARHHGDTLYVAKEEKLDATLHKKLQDKEVAHPNLFVSDFLPDDLSKYDFIFLDSVNKLGLSPKDLDELRKKYPGKSFIFIFQTTKQGQFRGRNEFQHDVDVVIEIPEPGRAVQFGRFNQGGEMEIFEEGNKISEVEEQEHFPNENL